MIPVSICVKCYVCDEFGIDLELMRSLYVNDFDPEHRFFRHYQPSTNVYYRRGD